MDASELAVEETGAAIKAVLGVGIEEAFLCMRARSERKDEEEASWDAPKNGASDVGGSKRKREKKREPFFCLPKSPWALAQCVISRAESPACGEGKAKGLTL